MNFYGMVVQQNGQLYSIFTPNGVMVCQVYMGNDGAFLLDAKCVQYLCKLLARRWNISNK